MELIENGYKKIRSSINRNGARAIRSLRQRRRLKEGRELFIKNDLLGKTPNRRYLQEIDEYWRKHYGKAVDPLWHVVCANVIGKEDVRYIPHHIWFDEIIPFFNKMSMRPAYLDKNLSDILLSNVTVPETVVKRIHGRYYNRDYNWISREAALSDILSGQREQIIKGSLTDNGVGVRALTIIGQDLLLDGHATSLEALEGRYGSDFIIQVRISQHPTMAAPHPSSVNTVRPVTFRWKDDIQVLLAFARFGIDGKLTDNAATGGVWCGIGEGGQLNPTAVDEYGTVYERHPTTGYFFGQRLAVPNFKKICEQAVRLHRRIFHYDIASWDFVVGEDAEPIFLEVNFQGASFLYQFACEKPLFGDLTEEVLEFIRDSSGGMSRVVYLQLEEK
jgi:hypothetical protein